MIKTHAEALNMLDDLNSYQIPSIIATRLVRGDNQDIRLEYHGSVLVTYHQDNTCTLSSCGYKSHTTKKRLNKFSPASIVCENEEWFISVPNGREVFEDGIRVDSEGIPISHSLSFAERRSLVIDRLDNLIRSLPGSVKAGT